MKKIYLLLLTVTCFSQAQTSNKLKINSMLDKWHAAAAQSNFNDYFNLLTSSAVFIGTDATENWTKDQFMTYAKPYFDLKKGWKFTTLQRHIYLTQNGQHAWFDELLSTQMKLCRGSGFLVKTKIGWRIQHYVLSMTIPNTNVTEVTQIKSAEEDALLLKMTK